MYAVIKWWLKNLKAELDKFQEKYPDDFNQIELKLTGPLLSYKTLEEKLEDKK